MMVERKLADLPVALTLYESVKRGSDSLGSIKERIGKTFRCSWRSTGGDWLATADYIGTRDEMLEMFTEGIMRQVIMSLGGLGLWCGFVAEMRLTLHMVKS